MSVVGVKAEIRRRAIVDECGSPTTHLASKIHCVDDEIIEWLERRDRRRRGRGSAGLMLVARDPELATSRAS
jgi:hypothetical protein